MIYTLCYRLVFIHFSHFSFQFAALSLFAVRWLCKLFDKTLTPALACRVLAMCLQIGLANFLLQNKSYNIFVRLCQLLVQLNLYYHECKCGNSYLTLKRF